MPLHRRRHTLSLAALATLTVAACGPATPVDQTRHEAGTSSPVRTAAIARDTAASPRTATTATVAATSTAPGTTSTAQSVFAGRPWGVYKGLADQAWAPYLAATGETKTALGKIALTPKAKWFGSWIPTDQIATKVRDYVAKSQDGNPEALVQVTVFRVDPWEHEACRRLPTVAEKTDYRAWVDRFAQALGNTPTAVILQPDGPFALCAPEGSRVLSRLVRYAAVQLEAQPRTDVYIEAGAYDWPNQGGQGGAEKALTILLRGGIGVARGVALNGTHYSDPVLEVRRGVDLVRLLEARGIAGKKVVINTATSGNPFEFGRYTGADPDNAFVCTSPADHRTCVTLGIPPTPDPANPQWGLPAATRSLAARYVDAFVWFGRPWLYRQADPFVQARALRLVASSPFAGYLPHVPDGTRG